MVPSFNALPAILSAATHPSVAKAASYAYANRAQAASAARTIGNAYKRYRASRVSRKRARVDDIGVSGGTGTSQKSVMGSRAANSYDSRTINMVDVTNILKEDGTNVAAIDRRGRQCVFVKGFNIQLVFRNLKSYPIVCNWALVHPLRNQDVTNITSGFYRDFTASRDIDHTPQLSSIIINNNSISPDRFAILARGKFMLAQSSNPNPDPSRAAYRFVKRYVRLNKQIRFNDDNDSLAEDQIWFLHWADQIDANAGTIEQVGTYQLQHQIVTYFRPPKMF